MKGIVFTVFIDFAEQRFGQRVVHDAITGCDLASGGAYTAVGTYDHRELVSILGRLAASAAVPAGTLLNDFGTHLFCTLAARYSTLVSRYTDSFSLLGSIETVIHPEVLKLYPDAELPRFSHERPAANRLELTYHSSRGLGPLVDGLLRGCFQHFGETIQVERRDLSQGHETQVLFILQKL
ncbi:MAG: heme NO-binding domain-containing protein [Planctomycetes bacterium]|nr:heme NO-binding domain-containing protein [Planctomycetota bacterium]